MQFDFAIPEQNEKTDNKFVVTLYKQKQKHFAEKCGIIDGDILHSVTVRNFELLINEQHNKITIDTIFETLEETEEIFELTFLKKSFLNARCKKI